MTVLVVIVGVLAGAGYLVWSLFFGPVDPEERAVLPSAVSGFSDVCTRGRQAAVFATAAPYAGSGSHPMVVFRDGTHPAMVAFGGKPAELAPTNVAEVQLVACTDRIGTGPTVKTCPMQNHDVPLIEATHEVTVYEARSREVLARLTLVGRSTACPPAVVFRDGDDPKVYTEVTPEQYVDALGPYTTGSPRPFI